MREKVESALVLSWLRDSEVADAAVRWRGGAGKLKCDLADLVESI
jgi:hypothetical protein